jgi:hypothetical protein
VDRETDVVQGDQALASRKGHLLAGDPVVEAVRPVGPRMEQRDAHRHPVFRIGLHASALVQVLGSEIAERAADHVGPRDELRLGAAVDRA